MRRLYMLATVMAFSTVGVAQLKPFTPHVSGQAKKTSIHRESVTNTLAPSNVQRAERENKHYPANAVAKSMTLWEQVIGITTYDNQSNSSMQSRIILDDNNVAHATWTMSTQANSTTWPDRGTGYNSGQNNSWGEEPADRQEDFRCGWPGLCRTGDGGEAIFCHQGVDSITMQKRSSIGEGAWEVSRLPGTLTNDFLWPRVATDGNTIHVIALSAPSGNLGGTPLNGVDGNLAYWRSSDNGATWDIQSQLFAAIDSNEFEFVTADSYAIDARNGKVSIGIFSQFSDAILISSEDGGNSWNSTIIWDFPITGYSYDTLSDVDGDSVADIIDLTDGCGAVLIGSDGTTHVSFGYGAMTDDTPDDTFYSVYITEDLLYWNTNYATDSIYIIGTIQQSTDTSVAVGIDQNPDYGTSLASMPTMGEDADGNIFVVFSAADEDYMGTQVFRHIFARKLAADGTPIGDQVELTQDLELNEYEYVFPSMWRNASDKLHIVVQRDTQPGLNVRGDLDASDYNDIIYLAVTNDLNSVNEASQPVAEINLFPNPTTGVITISGKDLGNAPVRVFDALGKEIIHTRINKSFNSLDRESFDFTYLPAGNYTMALGSGETRVSKEFVIQH
jgi:hypothetical protein